LEHHHHLDAYTFPSAPTLERRLNVAQSDRGDFLANQLVTGIPGARKSREKTTAFDGQAMQRNKEIGTSIKCETLDGKGPGQSTSFKGLGRLTALLLLMKRKEGTSYFTGVKIDSYMIRLGISIISIAQLQ
jgi:hypothetical protein